MSGIVEKVAVAIVLSSGATDAYTIKGPTKLMPWEIQKPRAKMCIKAALEYLAENVSDEMVLASIMLPDDPKAEQLKAAFKNPKHKDTVERVRASIARALRQAIMEAAQ